MIKTIIRLLVGWMKGTRKIIIITDRSGGVDFRVFLYSFTYLFVFNISIY